MKNIKKCAICNEAIKDNLIKVDYLKIDGSIGIQMMHDNCYKKIKKMLDKIYFIDYNINITKKRGHVQYYEKSNFYL